MIGLDLDNTVVCYDGVFDAVAREQGLIDEGPPRTKGELRDELRAQGREHQWTVLQGYVYGPGMALANPFEGALEFVGKCSRVGVEVAIVSHRTLHPYAGPPYDLHAAAREWLHQHRVQLAADAIHLEETREGKLRRIGDVGCKTFVDDLPEFLADPEFPQGVRRVLFDPHGAGAPAGVERIASWREAGTLLA